MSKQSTFTKCFEQLCRTNQTEIKSTYANDFIAWCKYFRTQAKVQQNYFANRIIELLFECGRRKPQQQRKS